MADWGMTWNDDKILRRTNAAIDATSKEVAENVMADAKKILKKKAKTTTEKGLLDQFYVTKSKFTGGGYIVYSQGPQNWRPPYHASFLEMGTFKDQAKPYLRPANKMNKRPANKLFQDNLNKEMAKP